MRHEQNQIENDEVENLERRWMKQVELSKEWNWFVKEKIRRLQKPVWRNEKYKKRVYTLLWRKGNNKIEKSVTESSVSM